MPNILLLSPNENQGITLKKIVPKSVELICADSIQAVYTYLQDEKDPPFLILIDCSQHLELLIYCNDISERYQSPKIPVFVLINSISFREMVMENGVDGYLVLPILANEFNMLINRYLAFRRMQQIHEEMENNTAHIAYMVVISRIIIESRDIDPILSKVLQQIVNIFDADGGEIWLFTEDGESLNLESSLYSSAPSQPNHAYKLNQGLIGWAGSHKESLVVDHIKNDPRFNEQKDYIHPKMMRGGLLATSMITQGKNKGVIALYRQNGKFQPREVFLLEEIASLVAMGIVNAQSLQSLNYFAEQQRVLYEMSQQINTGLDLSITLERVIHWIGRLTDTEISIVWLMDEDNKNLVVVTGMGVEMPDEPFKIALGDFDFTHLSIVIEDPGNHPFTAEIVRFFDFNARNALVLPIEQGGNLLGMVTLFNKVNGIFLESELKLLITAIEMVAGSVSNAGLYKQTHILMDEKERLHQKALQNERLRTIGRLTASVAHEINNPMQAIRGALSLALEEIQNPKELQEYLLLSQRESDRVIKLVNRMRQLYRPTLDQPEALRVISLIKEAMEISQDEMVRLNVNASLTPPETSPICFAIANHLHLAFLTILLNRTDAMGEVGGGRLTIKLMEWKNIIQIEFIVQPPINSAFNLDDSLKKPDSIESQVAMLSGFSPVLDAIEAYGGKLNLLREETQTTLTLDLFNNKPV